MVKKNTKDFFFGSEQMGWKFLSCASVRKRNRIRAIIQLVHGMCEHKERYIPFMEYLAEQGFVTVIHDHRGHGKGASVPERDLGYMYGSGARGNA